MKVVFVKSSCSVFIVLNACCLANLLRSLSSLGVIFRDLSVLRRSFTLESGFCQIQFMATSVYGDREIQHFNRNILWAQLRLVEEVLLVGDAFL
jgi:hypothetical protein